MKVSIKEIRERIICGDVGEAIRMLDEVISSHMEWGISDSLKSVADGYSLMLTSMASGMNDPKLDDNFFRLRLEAYRVLAKVKWHIRSSQNKSFITVYGESSVFDADYCQSKLESFFANELIGEGDISQHQAYINKVFSSLTNQELWNDELAQKMEVLLMSPTIDIKDRLMMTTAIMLSAAGTFDLLKLIVLLHVYLQADEDELRVRALVGWVMSIDIEMLDLYSEQSHLLDAYVNDERMQDDLYALQLQLAHCVNALQDNKAIKDEILPDLVKNHGVPDIDIRIIENPEDIDDFEEREAAEDKINALQDKVEQMMDMQRQGSDIYFGGFSAMKRYPFFSTLSNWFCPFYTEHPDLQGIYKGDISPKIVNALLNAVPFCDSDKYSFALTMDVVVQKIPKQMLELLGTGELKSMEDYAQLPKFAILLRNYLQDLFRFFRLCPMNTKFVNIFDKEKCLFITNPVFSKCAFTRKTANVARLIKKNDNYDYFEYLVLHASIETPDMLGIIANYHFGCGQIDVAERLFMELYKKNPESKTAIRGLARVYASAERYDEVLKMYELLEGIDPGKISTKLNIAVCMTHIDKTDEAIKMLAKLNYENPNHANILSCFGWAYLVSGNIDMALKKYLSAVEAEDATTYDHFMLGIAYFCAGDIAKAADEIIQDFLPEDTYDDVNDAISEECADVSDMYDLTFAKQIALSDIVYNRLKRQE